MIDPARLLVVKILGYTLCFFSLIAVPAVWFIDDMDLGKKILIAGAGVLIWPFMAWFRYWEHINVQGVQHERDYRTYILVSWLWYTTVALVGAGLLTFGIYDLIRLNFAIRGLGNLHHIIVGVAALGFGLLQMRKLLTLRSLEQSSE